MPKRRAGTRTPATSPEVPLTPVPPPAAPELERRAAPTPVPTPAGVGADDGVLKRVPRARPTP